MLDAAAQSESALALHRTLDAKAKNGSRNSVVNADHTFRIGVIFGIFVVVSVGLYYRLKSQATGEKLDRRQEGFFILATLRPMGFTFWLALIVYMVNPPWLAWSSVPLPAWLRLAGVGLLAVASGLLFWTLAALGKNLTDTVVTRREHTLVTHGPYRWIRHPFYDSVALLVLANSLMAANWFFFLAGGLLILLLVTRTRTEEEKLRIRFGDAYRTYMERTGRFLPKIRRPRRVT